MSKVTDVYKVIRARIDDVLLSGHERMVDPYRPENNDDYILVKGWGLQILSGQNVSDENGFFRLRESFVLVITREIITNDHDRLGVEDVESLLREDMNIVGKDAEGNVTFGDSDNVEDFRMVSHGGIRVLSREKRDFLKIEVVFRLQYSQST